MAFGSAVGNLDYGVGFGDMDELGADIGDMEMGEMEMGHMDFDVDVDF